MEDSIILAIVPSNFTLIVQQLMCEYAVTMKAQITT